jgi:putative ABC transport system substrate-binding protein
MRRREFIALAGASITWPFAAMAQEPGRTYRLGSLSRTPRSDPAAIAFFEGLRQYGFVEGQNLLADPNGNELRTEQFAGHASEIVKQGVDLIVFAGDDAIRAAQQATKVIPILAGTDDMLGAGFVHSMAKPDGNVSGHSIMSFEMNGKRQEILMELLPEVRHMAALADTYNYPPERLQALQELTRQRGVELSIYRVSKPEQIARRNRGGEKFGRARAQRIGVAVCVRSLADHLRASCRTIAAGHVPIPGNGRGGRVDRLRPEHHPSLAREHASAGRRTVARG